MIRPLVDLLAVVADDETGAAAANAAASLTDPGLIETVRAQMFRLMAVATLVLEATERDPAARP